MLGLGLWKANSVCIKKALATVNWDVLFHLKSVNEQVNVLMMLSIFSQTFYLINIQIEDRDLPLLKAKLNKKIKHLIYTKIIDWMIIIELITRFIRTNDNNEIKL